MTDGRTKAGDVALLVAVSVGSLMVIFDGSAFQMALPVVQQDLRTSIQGAQWTMTAFLLVSTCSLLPVGRLGDARGRERVWRLGIVLFVAASVLCALVRGLPWLVFGRALQGFAAALLTANSAPILVVAFPDKAGKMLGYGNIALAAGMVAGPPAGAILTKLISWRAIFLVAIPIGAAVWLTTRTRLPRSERHARPLDLLGGLLATVGLAGILLGGTSGPKWGWSSMPTLAAFGTGAAALAWFAFHESRCQDPMLRLTLFERRGFVAGIASSFFAYHSLFVATTALPYFLLRAQERTLIAAGLLVSIVPIVLCIVAPIAGRLADKFGSRWPCSIALVALALAFVAIAVRGQASSTWLLALCMAFAGAGVGGFEAPNDVGVLKSTPSEDLGVATATLSASRNLGMTAGVATAATLLDWALTSPAGGASAAIASGVSHALIAGSSAAGIGAIISLFRDS